MVYVIDDGTLRRKNASNPRFNRPGPGKSINTICECDISNESETISIEFTTNILRSDTDDDINTKMVNESIIELAKYNV